MTVWLALVSAAAVVAFFGVLVVYLVALIRVLDALGGKPTSTLARIRMGVRAIESQTALLPPLASRLNESALALREGLQAVAGHLEQAARAVGGQR